jgi:hypothetical protein
VGYTLAGVLDTTFGDAAGDGQKTGSVITNLGGTDDGQSVTIDLISSRILVAGVSNSNFNSNFALVGYTLAGVLDTTFGDAAGDGQKTGSVITNLGGGGNTTINSITIATSGRILVAGGTNDPDIIVVGFTAAGVLDKTFGDEVINMATTNYNFILTFGSNSISGTFTKDNNTNILQSLKASTILYGGLTYASIPNSLINATNLPTSATVTYSINSNNVLTITYGSGGEDIISFLNVLPPTNNLGNDAILFYIKSTIVSVVKIGVDKNNAGKFSIAIYNDNQNNTELFQSATFTYNIVPDNQVCMPAGTVVQTDQGACCIESLDKRTHTLDGRRLVAVSKTIAHTEYSYMVLFRTHALGPNVPDKDTFVTTGHKVRVSDAEGEGGMVEAGTVLGWGTNPLVSAAQSQKGEILYNVLLDTYEVVTANNMRVETLHPSNPVARLYQEEEERQLNMLK